ncbi:MAG TPA: S41 family peptidase [Anaerolineales bacterium]|nr:S41 family peptidase [Anaerolineales bacterium]
MKIKTHLPIFIPTVFILLACQIFMPRQELTPEPTNLNLAEKPTSIYTPISLPSDTPTPTPTLPPSPLPAKLTPTLVFIHTPTPTPISLATQLSIFEDLWSIVDDTYVYPDFNGVDWKAIHEEFTLKIKNGLDTQQFYQEMSNLITRLGDDHSFFLDPQQVAEQQAEYEGKHDYVGIGVMVGAVPSRQRAVILSVITGSAAEAAGLQPRDSILSVNDIPILDGYGFLQDIVRGPQGTVITMTVQTPGELPRELHLTRQRVTGDYPLVYQLLATPDGKRIGYILLITFEDGTVDEQVASAIGHMTVEGPLDGLILDNRMNNGGTNTVLEPMLSYFSGGDLGYYLHQGEPRPLAITLDDIQGSSQVPLVILVGSGTASFGEIFAGILQDVGRAYLIGITTGGNVEILWGYDLEDGSQLWLANETFLPMNHPDQDWEKTGIIPDLTVPGDFDEYSLGNDPAVLAALGYLAER